MLALAAGDSAHSVSPQGLSCVTLVHLVEVLVSEGPDRKGIGH